MGASCLYQGTILHHRHHPRDHRFRYRLFMVYLDLGELDKVFRGRWLWSTRRPALARFKREDYLGDPETSLEQAVRDLVETRIDRRPVGPIRLLTHLRYAGYCFNPVSFYYCYEADGETLDAVVAEITNTPWNERHAYVLDIAASRRAGKNLASFTFDKQFHVSPFMAMDQSYRWRLSAPSSRLLVQMENHERGEKLFDATLTLRRHEITGRSLAGALLGFPLMTLQVLARIYLQAARLWLKRVPFHPHPRTVASGSTEIHPEES